jgi:1-deoxy-D-xylulose-5-phosphate synthase
MIIYAPKDEIDLRNILYTASLGLQLPIAIRYPRGRGKFADFRKRISDDKFQNIEIGKAHLLKSGTKIAVLSTGFIGNNVDLALDKSTNANEIAHYDFGFVKPLDEKLLHEIFNSFETIITIEDGVIKGGFGSGIIEFASENNYKNPIKTIGIPDDFIEHGTVEELQQICKIDVKSLEKLFSTI